MAAEPQPRWYAQLLWSAPLAFKASTKLDSVPRLHGLYAFTTDTMKLSKRNCLYLGKSDGADTSLRERLGSYRRVLGNARMPPSEHAGLVMLQKYLKGAGDLAVHPRVAEKSPPPLFLRWTIVSIAREIEGRLIELFEPEFNSAFPDYDVEDFELIEARFLPRSGTARR